MFLDDPTDLEETEFLNIDVIRLIVSEITFCEYRQFLVTLTAVFDKRSY